MAARRKPARKGAARKKKAVRKKKAGRKKPARKKKPVRKKKAGRKKPARKKPARKKAAGRKKPRRKPSTPKKVARAPAAPPRAAPAVVPRPAPEPAAPVLATPAPPVRAVPPTPAAPREFGRPPAAQAEEYVGIVTHYFPHVDAAAVRIEAGEIRVGDLLRFEGHTTDFEQRVNRIELEHAEIEVARVGQLVGIQVSERVREHDRVLKVRS
jgi:putative protease